MSGRRVSPRAVLGVAGVVVVGFLGWKAVDALYFTKRAELETALERSESEIAKMKSRRIEAVKLGREMDTVLASTLGANAETVDSRLRARLNRIAEQVKLQEPIVSTSSLKPLESPRRREMPRGSRGPWKALRAEVDFVEAPATVTGSGTLEQAIELVDRLEAEPWPKQIRMVKLDPSKDGTAFRVTVQLATLFFPGRGAEAPEEAAWDPARVDRLAQLVAANPFRVPPPPPPPVVVAEKPVVEAPKPPPPKPAFPWNEWMVTGVADGPGGEEVWLRNHRSKKTRILQTGQTIGKAVFKGGRGDGALFEIDQQPYVVLVGENLDQRRSDSR